MRYPTSPEELRRRRLVVIGVATALLLIAFTTYAVLVHRSHTTSTAPAGDSPARSEAAPATPAAVDTKLSALRDTSDPEAFAREVAEALFAWDTATLVGRDDHIEQLLKLADPTGESTSGLLADVSNYLPTPDAWVDLAQYETRQWLTLDSVSVPSKWTEAQAQAGDELLPGTTAYTIHGTRHRTGVWEGEPVSSEHEVAFTVFIVCGPAYPTCHLLRVSELDNPLD